MRSQSKGIGSADNSASLRRNIRTIPALLHCALHWRDNALRIRSKAGGTRVCQRACLLQPLVVRRFAPNSKGMAIRSALLRAGSVLDNATHQVRERAGARHERRLFPVTCMRLLGWVRRCSGHLSAVFSVWGLPGYLGAASA
jgi:hypothetical protein